jgi:hypothetical protein
MAARVVTAPATGFWIFPFHRRRDGSYEQLAPARPAIFDRMENRTVHLKAIFATKPGIYDVYAGVGPNPLEAQQTAQCGKYMIKNGESMGVHVHIDITLPDP